MAKLDDGSKGDLLTLPQVIGVGYGYKTVGGIQTSQEAIVVLVRKKLPPEQLPENERVPDTINDMVTDVVEVGEIKALKAEPLEPLQSRTDKVRPAPPGVSIGHYLVTAGTFGAVVYDGSSAHPMILSNNHVLANSTNGNDQRASVGDRIYQPGPIDFVHVDLGYADRQYIIGCLKRFVSLADFPTLNEVDCAIAGPLDNSTIIPEILDIGLVQGVTGPVVGLAVKKSGRTTGLTFGQITLVDALVDVQYSPGRLLRFDHQIVTTNMSAGGDSGSLVLDTNNLAVGLLFAGSADATILNPIQTVLDSLGVYFG